jgi:hypothetical protein
MFWCTKVIFTLFFLKKIAEKTLNLLKSVSFAGDSLTDKNDIENIKTFLKAKSDGTSFFLGIFQNLDSLSTIFHHKELASRQRSSYQYMKTNLPEDYLFIDIDYKQKVIKLSCTQGELFDSISVIDF